MFKTRQEQEFEQITIKLGQFETVFTPWSNTDIQHIEKFKNALDSGNYKELANIIREAIKDPESNKMHWLDLSKNTGLFLHHKQEYILAGEMFMLRAENYPKESKYVIEVTLKKALEVYKKGAIHGTDIHIRKVCNEQGRELAITLNDEDSLDILKSEPIDPEIKEIDEMFTVLEDLKLKQEDNEKAGKYDPDLQKRITNLEKLLETL